MAYLSRLWKAVIMFAVGLLMLIPMPALISAVAVEMGNLQLGRNSFRNNEEAACGKYTLEVDHAVKLNSSSLSKNEEFNINSCIWEFSSSKCILQVEFLRFDFIGKSCGTHYLIVSDGWKSKRYCDLENPDIILRSSTKWLSLIFVKRMSASADKSGIVAVVSCRNKSFPTPVEETTTVLTPTTETTLPPTATTSLSSQIENYIPLESSECTCGIRNQDGRIVGGEESQPYEHPWMAALFRDSSKSSFCGGTLISQNFILTAAHCFAKITSASNIKVVLGLHNTSDLSTASEYKLRKIVVHENFDRKTLSHDIALLVLEEKINFAETGLQTVCLPTTQEIKKMLAGRTGTITGWGAVSTGVENKYSNVLREADVKIMSNFECHKYYPRNILPTMMCAGFKQGGVDSCQGDSGGPLIVSCNVKYREQYCVAGIVSWGDGCAQPRAPGVYTNCYFQELYEWILRHMRLEESGSVCSRD